MFKNSEGKPSASFTMMSIGFFVVSLWLVLSIFEKIGGLNIRPFSGTEAAGYFVPLLSLYFGRRFTDKNGNVVEDVVTTVKTANTTVVVDDKKQVATTVAQ
jgi:hypothetical protein